jgi:heme-degrading monooxygenase HmoA
MHTVIRRYEGVTDTAEVTRRAVAEFAPLISGQAGFQGYWVVDAGDGVIATITVFETEEAANDSIAAAARWVRENAADLAPNPPQVTAGATAGVMAEVPA